MNDDKQICNKIKTKQLPLSYMDMDSVRNFFYGKRRNIHIISHDIPSLLRQDWLDTNLDPVERATKNITVNSLLWRTLLEKICDESIQIYLKSTKKSEKPIAVVLWRAGLSFLSSLDKYNIPMIHTKIKRNEETLAIETLMSICKHDIDLINNNKKREYIIPDVMLGSGNSFDNTIELLKTFGIDEKNITLISIVASPEGVFRLLCEHPDLKNIITYTLDGNLNENGYIVNKGLGDAGDKYFYQNSIENFIKYQHHFTENQWNYLKQLLGVKE